MLARNIFILQLTLAGIFSGCHSTGSQAGGGNTSKEISVTNNWTEHLDRELPMLGHRNWIAVVDKAFPSQNAPGIEIINTNENLLPVLKQVLHKINLSTHVRPIVYRDQEFSFLAENQVAGLASFRNESQLILENQPTQTILHNAVFNKLDQASKLFKVIVFKTNEVIPYSSVFIELDCSYWDESKERELRKKMEE